MPKRVMFNFISVPVSVSTSVPVLRGERSAPVRECRRSHLRHSVHGADARLGKVSRVSVTLTLHPRLGAVYAPFFYLK